MRPGALALTAALSCGLLAACGSGTVTIGGGGNNNGKKVTFKGNVRDVTPVTSRDIVVFVYRIDDDDASSRCPCPGDPSASAAGKAQVLPSGSTQFSLSGLDPGAFGVVFLLDQAGNNADGTIDPGDPIAILDDVDCDLEDVDGDITVTLSDIDLSFSTTPVAECKSGVANPPASGRARADLIRFATTTQSN
jgi:hypothetical protein